MANEIFKELKTRIALKYNTYDYWTTGEGKDYAPLKGEVCFCAIETKEQGAQTAPTVLFKVGVDGQTKFSSLKWASALAADVYDWAKVAGANVFTKDGVGNVVSGIEYDATLNSGKGGFKFTTASVATAEGLEELQKTVTAINKTITDNSAAWNKYEDTRYSFSTDGDKLVVKKTLYTNGVAGTEEAVGTYEFLTAAEVAETLKGYYTKGEADAKYVTGLAEGATNGTIKAVINGASGADVKVHGLQDAAYATVASLNTTAKEYADAVEAKLPTSANYGVLEVKDDEASGVVVDKTDAQRPIIKIAANTYDAHGAAAAVLGESTDGASANTVYGAKAAAAAAQSDATIAKTKIETFLGTVTPDDSQDIIDTLAEINSYVGEHGQEFATLSRKVTNIENGTTVVPKATDADTLDGHDSTYFATAESVSNLSNGLGDLAGKDKVAESDIDGTIGVSKISGLGALATKDNITYDLVDDFDAEVAKIKVTNAGNADTLGSQLPSYYATATSVTDITKDDGAIDSKIAAYNTSKNFGDIITHNVAEFATSEQGGKADSALQEVEVGTGLTVSAKSGNKQTIEIDTDVIFVLDCNW